LLKMCVFVVVWISVKLCSFVFPFATYYSWDVKYAVCCHT
jgi:hypothetical protein